MWCKFARDVVVFDSCASQTKCFRTCCPKPNPQVQGSSLRNISQVGTQIFIFNRFSFWIEVLKRSIIFRLWPKYLFTTWIILNKQFYKCCISPPLCKCKALIIFTSGPFPLPVDQYCYCHGAMIRFHKNFEKSCCNIFLGCEITWCQRGSGASNSPWVDDNAPVVLSMGRPRTVCWWLGIKGLGRLDLVRICGSLSGLVSRSRPYRALWSPGLFSPSYRRGKPQTTPWSKL